MLAFQQKKKKKKKKTELSEEQQLVFVAARELLTVTIVRITVSESTLKTFN
jgi:hypothetical protein